VARFQPRRGYYIPGEPTASTPLPVARLRSGEVTLFTVPRGVPPDLGARALEEGLSLLAGAKAPPPTAPWNGVAHSLLVRLDVHPAPSVTLVAQRVHFQVRGFQGQRFSTAFKPRITKKEEKRLAARPLD
jgi:hypothetical protein